MGIFGKKKDQPGTRKEVKGKNDGNLKAFAWGAWLMGLLGWVDMAVGIIWLQAACGDDDKIAWNGASTWYSAVNCYDSYRWYWFIWGLWLVILLMCAAAMASSVVHKWRGALVATLAIITTLLIWTVERLMTRNQVVLEGVDERVANVYIAGAAISAFAAWLLILYKGVHDEDAGRVGSSTTANRGATTSVPISTNTAEPAGYTTGPAAV